MKHFIPFFLLTVISIPGLSQSSDEKAPLNSDNAIVRQQIDSLNIKSDEIDPLLDKKPGKEEKREAMIWKYGKRKGPLIADGRVWTGVSPEMAEDSWGKPESKKRSEGPWGVNETWYYPEGRHIFFENGRVSQWKE